MSDTCFNSLEMTGSKEIINEIKQSFTPMPLIKLVYIAHGYHLGYLFV